MREASEYLMDANLDQLTSLHWKRVRHATNRCKRWRRGQGTASSKPAELKMSPCTQFQELPLCLWGPLSISLTPQPFSWQPRPSVYGIEFWRILPKIREWNDYDKDILLWAKVRHFVTFFFLFLLPSTGSSASASPLYNSPPSLQIQSLSKGIIQV